MIRVQFPLGLMKEILTLIPLKNGFSTLKGWRGGIDVEPLRNRYVGSSPLSDRTPMKVELTRKWGIEWEWNRASFRKAQHWVAPRSGSGDPSTSEPYAWKGHLIERKKLRIPVDWSWLSSLDHIRSEVCLYQRVQVFLQSGVRIGWLWRRYRANSLSISFSLRVNASSSQYPFFLFALELGSSYSRPKAYLLLGPPPMELILININEVGWGWIMYSLIGMLESKSQEREGARSSSTRGRSQSTTKKTEKESKRSQGRTKSSSDGEVGNGKSPLSHYL